MPDLHARLLAEIERREGRLVDSGVRFGFRELSHITKDRAYLGALRKIALLHVGPHQCHDLEGTVTIVRDECATLLVVAEGLGVEVE